MDGPVTFSIILSARGRNHGKKYALLCCRRSKDDRLSWNIIVFRAARKGGPYLTVSRRCSEHAGGIVLKQHPTIQLYLCDTKYDVVLVRPSLPYPSDPTPMPDKVHVLLPAPPLAPRRARVFEG